MILFSNIRSLIMVRMIMINDKNLESIYWNKEQHKHYKNWFQMLIS